MALAWTPTTPDWQDGSGGGTPIDQADLDAFNAGILSTNADLVVLYWNGTTYLPRNGNTTAIGDSSKGRLFIGPTDPATVSGVFLADGDEWDQR